MSSFRYLFDNHDAFSIVISFFDHKSLNRCSCISKEWKELLDEHLIWHQLCLKRWDVSHRVRKVLGVTTWKAAYRLMLKRQRLPKGLYTEKYNRIFGRGRKLGIDSWVLMGHTSNARPILKYNVYTMEVRLCIQNVHNSFVSLNINDTNVKNNSIRLMCKQEDSTVSTMNLCNIRVIARNGVKYHEEDHYRIKEEDNRVYLYPLEYIVVACHVEVPSDVMYESDLLARLSSVDLFAQLMPGVNAEAKAIAAADVFDNDDCYYHHSMNYQDVDMSLGVVNTLMKCDIVDEKCIWESYMELPGGVVLLRDANTMTD